MIILVKLRDLKLFFKYLFPIQEKKKSLFPTP